MLYCFDNEFDISILYKCCFHESFPTDTMIVIETIPFDYD